MTIELRRASWRVNLRNGEMMDRGDTWSQIDSEVADAVTASWEVLCRAWDEMYPSNPVGGEDDEREWIPTR